MSTRNRLIAVVICFVAVLIGRPSAAYAVDIPQPISPLTVQADPIGVNISTGNLNVDVPTLSVPAAPRLKFDKLSNIVLQAVGNFKTTVGGDEGSSAWSVHLGNSSEAFRCGFVGGCHSVNGTGSKLDVIGSDAPATYQRAGSGEIYDFGVLVSTGVPCGTTCEASTWYAGQIRYPDGEVISFVRTTTNGYARVTKISDNLGYYITLSYHSDNPGTIQFLAVKEAALYSNADTVNPLARLTYSAPTGLNSIISVTDLAGRTWYIMNGLGGAESRDATVQLPTESSPALTLNPRTNETVIKSVVRDGVAWNYAYTNITPSVNGGYFWDGVTVTGPNSYTMTYATNSVEGGQNRVTSSTDVLGRVTTYGYDIGNRVNHIVYPEGNSVDLLYGVRGMIKTKTTHAKPGTGLPDIVESLEYPEAFLSCGDEDTSQYVMCWRPISYTDARGNVTSYSYNDNTHGQLTKQLNPPDANGDRRLTDITYTINAAGLSTPSLVRVCKSSSASIDTATCSGNAESRTEYTYWNNTALPLTVTQKDEATGETRTTSYAYDNAGRVLSIDGPLPGTNDAQYFRYDSVGRKTWEIGAADANGVRVAKRISYRNSDDKVTKVETGTIPDPNGTSLTLLQQTDTTYDSRRNPIREATSSGSTTYRVTDRSFLDRGLVDCTTVRMNMTSIPAATATAACTLGTPGSDGNDRITKNIYDDAGQLLKVQKAYLTPRQQDYVTYAYTDNGKQQYVTDANGNKAQFKYDGFDRLQCWIFPHKTTAGAVSGDCVSTGDYEKYGYDAAGNRTSLRKRDGSTLTYTYDNLNRMLTKVVPSRADLTAAQTRDVYYMYDIAGHQTRARFDSVSGDGVTNTYTGFGELKTSQIGMVGFSKTLTSHYDSAGRRDQLSIPNLTLTYGYDDRSRLTGLYQGAGTATPLVTFAYNTDDTLASRAESSGTTASSVNYTWDELGRLKTQSDAFAAAPASNVSWSFAINPASQIASEARTLPNSSSDPYAYTSIVPVNRNYAVNGLNQYTSAGTAAFTYDLNGNLTADGTNAYTYDIENRLVKAVAGGATTNLVYDPLGRLWQVQRGSADTRFIYDGDALVTEYDAAGTALNRYAHGPNAGADDPLVWFSGAGLLNKRYLHADHLGSIVAATNGVSAPSINAYDEYGVPQTDAATHTVNLNTGRFQYTGQAFIPELGAGMYYYKARMYSAFLGRFLQTDPIGYEGGINLYGYVENDPVNDVDSMGLASDCTGSRADTGGGEGICSGASGASTASATGNTRTVTNQQSDKASQSASQNGTDAGKSTNLLMPAGNGVPRDCDTAAMCQSSKDDLAYINGDMTESQLAERRQARADGAITGLAAIEGGLALRGIARVVAKNVAIEGSGKAARYGTGRVGQIRFGGGRLILRLDRPPRTGGVYHLNIESHTMGFNWHIPVNPIHWFGF